MLKNSLATKLLIALLTLALLWLFWPAAPALADDPPICYTYDFTTGQHGWEGLGDTYYVAGQGWDATDGEIVISKVLTGTNVGFVLHRYEWLVYSGPYVKTDAYLDDTITMNQNLINTYPPPGYAWEGARSYVPSEQYNKLVATVNHVSGTSGRPVSLYKFCASFELKAPTPLSCSVVPDADFDIDEGGPWTLAGTASINQSTATLPPGSAVSQNVSLTANNTYNAVISATVVNPVELVAGLGFGENSDNETISVISSGWYTATLTTPANLYGPIAYTLYNNDQSDSINIGFTCLYGDITSENFCIHPTNGSFTTANGWEWYRGAQWENAAKNAKLPYNPGDPAAKALVTASDRYTMPTLAEGDYLLLSFDAQTEISQSAMVASLVRGNTATIEAYMEVYPGLYEYEIDISDVAGESYTYLAFANSGVSPQGGAELKGPVFLDNVCVFITDRPPNLPAPVDPYQIDPIQLGFGYTSCSDVDGILAYFGVNMAQYRAIYMYDPPGWDPSGWVPWLVAAFWNILASYLCMFMAAFVSLVRVIEYGINNFQNIGTWLVREWRLLVLFIDDLWAWVTGTTSNMGGWFSSQGGRILGWFLASGGNLLVFLAFLVSFYFGNVLDLFGWLSTGLLPRGVSLGKNALIDVVNWIIQAWNLFISALGPTLSSIVEIGLTLWAYLVPFLGTVFWAVSSTIAPIFMFASFIAVAWGLFWMLLTWIWAYGFMLVHVPINFYYAFNSGVSDDSFSYLLSCSGENFWCGLLAGVQLVNTVAGHTILYPIVITGIILGTIAIFWKYIWETFTIEIR